MDVTSRERVLAAAERKPSDRVPVELGGTTSGTISRIAHGRLLEFLDMEPGPDRHDVLIFGTVHPDPRLLDRYGVDMAPVTLKPSTQSRARRIDERTFQDDFGGIWQSTELYTDMVKPALAEPSIEALERMPWPDPTDPSLVEGLRDEVAALRESTDRAIVARSVTGGIFDLSFLLRGMDNFLVDLLMNRRFAEALLDKVEEFITARCLMFLDAVGDLVDVIEYGQDLGTQNSLLMARELYLKDLKPREARLFDALKARSNNAKLFYHCCGAVFEVIGDLIDSGADILNPVQPRAAGMDPERIVNEYGGDVSFCGGVDVQRLMVSGTPEEVGDETRRVASILGRYDGYILAASHNIQPDVPPENIEAMYTALDSV